MFVSTLPNKVDNAVFIYTYTYTLVYSRNKSQNSENMITAAQADLAFSVCKILVLLIFLSVLSLNVVLLEVILFSLKTCTYFLSFVQVKHSTQTQTQTLRIMVLLPIPFSMFSNFQPVGGLVLNIFQLCNLFFTALLSMLLDNFWSYCEIIYDVWQKLEVKSTKMTSSVSIQSIPST